MRWGKCICQEVPKEHESVVGRNALVGTWGEGGTLKTQAQVKTIER